MCIIQEKLAMHMHKVQEKIGERERKKGREGKRGELHVHVYRERRV